MLEWDGDIPNFETCHAELLKARDFMDGPTHAAAPAPLAADGRDAVSTPVDFMIPNAMAAVRGDQT